jgi:hypothetical protein
MGSIECLWVVWSVYGKCGVFMGSMECLWIVWSVYGKYGVFMGSMECLTRYRLPRNLNRGSVAAQLLRLRVRNPSLAWLFLCCKCCVLSRRGLGVELITRPDESYRTGYV